MIYYAKTHKGNIRRTNEDSIYAPSDGSGFFAVVADGMGGHNAGEVASKIAVETIISAFSELKPQDVSSGDIKRVLTQANSNVWQDAEQNRIRRGMGSTVTLAVFKEGKALLGHVGDSRAYLYRDGALSQITKDHSYVQMLLDNGYISKEEAAYHPQKNIITRAVGTEAEVEADVYTIRLKVSDIVLLCTDGLNTCVDDEKIAQIIGEGIGNAADRLVEAALEGGGSDNVSVVLAMAGGDAV